MNTSTEHILQCSQLEPLVEASGRRLDLMNQNVIRYAYSRIHLLELAFGVGRD